MSNQNAIGPHKVVLGTYSSHPAAQHAVDTLAEHKFPVEHVTIVGTGLKIEEHVLGRRHDLGAPVVDGVGKPQHDAVVRAGRVHLHAAPLPHPRRDR